MPNMRPPHALSGGRLAALGATRDSTTGCAGSIPPALSELWNRLYSTGVEVHLYDRGAPNHGEQETPDQWLQLRMLEDMADHMDDPGTVALKNFVRWLEDDFTPGDRAKQQ